MNLTKCAWEQAVAFVSLTLVSRALYALLPGVVERLWGERAAHGT